MIREINGPQKDIAQIGGTDNREPASAGYLSADGPEPIDVQPITRVDLPHPIEPQITVTGSGGGEPVGGVPGKEPTGVDLPHPVEPTGVDLPHPVDPDDLTVFAPTDWWNLPPGYFFM